MQSFPDTFVCTENDAQAYKQFGNSVNVECVKLFAKYMFGDETVREKYSYQGQFGEADMDNMLIK